MTSTADLEAALDTAWTLDNLHVYGDHLQEQGDPRGELIGTEVAIARDGENPELLHRRRRALRQWLQLEPEENPTTGRWSSVTFAYGFVEDCRVDSIGRVLASPAAPFLRGATLQGKTAAIEHCLVELARAQRPWLTRLAIEPRFRGEPPGRTWRTELPNIANTQLPALIRQTPRLDRLVLAGHRLIKEFPHPRLRQLRISGIDALLPILEARAALPAVTQLVFAFARAPGEPVVLARPWPALLPAASFPALRRLDLSPNELQRATTDTQVGVFDVLPTLGVLEQLEELRLPSIRNGQEAQVVQRALDGMPALRKVEVLRGWGKHRVHHASAEVVEVSVPWPRHDLPHATGNEMWFMFGGGELLYVQPRHLIVQFERVLPDLDEPTLAAWLELWQRISRLFDVEPQLIDATTLLRALEGLGYLDANRDDAHHCWHARARLREVSPNTEVAIARRRRSFGIY